MPTDLPPAVVSPHHYTRTRMCGAPLELVRQSGEVTPAWFSCRWRHCTRCRRHYSARVTACAEARLEDAGDPDDVVMLTLTQPHRAGLSSHDFRRELELHRTLWNAMSRRLRWWSYRRRQGDVTADDEIPPPRLRLGRRRGELHPDWTETHDGVRWPAPTDDDGIIWALEVTAGGDSSGWHIHRHVLCSSRAVAERYNAAWQAAAAELGVVDDGRWTSTDLTELPAGQAVRYLVGYMSGKDELEALPNDSARRAMLSASTHMQRHNARGAFRPLGIGLEPSSDPVTHVSIEGHGRIPVAEFYRDSSVWRETRPGRPLAGGQLARDAWGASLPSVVTPLPWDGTDDGRTPLERLAWTLGHLEHVDARAVDDDRRRVVIAGDGTRHVVPIVTTPEEARRATERAAIRRRIGTSEMDPASCGVAGRAPPVTQSLPPPGA